METFDGFDFDTMTEIPTGRAPELVGSDEGTSFVRGVMYSLVFTLPCWLAIAGAVAALVA